MFKYVILVSVLFGLMGCTTTPSSTPVSKGMVSITFDDGWASAYNKAIVPLFNPVGMKTTHYVITKHMDGLWGYMNGTQILDMVSHGHEIASHTRTHPSLPDIDASQLKHELEGSRDELKTLLGVAPKNIAYPFGMHSPLVEQATKDAGYITGRTVGGWSTATSTGKQNDANTDQYALNNFCTESSTTFDIIKNQIDKAVADNTWLILCFHEVDKVGDQYSISSTILQQMIDYLIDKKVLVVTVQEAADRLMYK